jgi:elongation factor Tu
MAMPEPAYAVVPFIGPDGAGKTALANAVARSFYGRDPSSVTPPRSVQVSGMNARVFELRTARRLYQLVDFETAEVEARLLASSPLAGAVLVVSALDGVVPGTRDSLQRAREAGVSRLAGVVTKCDAVEDAELVELVSMELEEAMRRYEYAQGNAPIVQVSAAGAMRGDHRWAGSAFRLMDAMDAWR